MPTYGRILVPIDFSDSESQALRFACGLAKRHHAQLHLVHVFPAIPPLTSAGGDATMSMEEFQEHLRSDAEVALRGVASSTWTDGLDVRQATVGGSPHREIIQYANEQSIDLICLGTHGRTGLSRVLLGSVAEQVVQRASCAVLIVRGSSNDSSNPPENALNLRRVLVPVDFSEFSDAAMLQGAELARDFDTELHLIHVIEDNSPAMSEMAQSLPVFQAYLRDMTMHAEGRLNGLLIKAAPLPAVVKRKALVGTAFEQITGYAKQFDIDLIVMGTHGRSGFAHWFLGSVAARVVRLAPCSVLVTRPNDLQRLKTVIS